MSAQPGLFARLRPKPRIGIIASQARALPVVAATAAFSPVTYLLLWNGKFQRLDNNGGVGLLIDLAILALVLVVQWPDF